MRIFKIKAFHRWAKSQRVTDKMLKEAVVEISNGLVDANLGAGLLKKRIARPKEGKRSGYRTFVGYKENGRTVFFFGFPKSEMDDIEDAMLIKLKQASADYLSLSKEKIELLLKTGDLIEVK